MTNLTVRIEYRVQVLDKWKADNWLTYPEVYQTREEADQLVTALRKTAPRWKYRVKEVEIWT